MVNYNIPIVGEIGVDVKIQDILIHLNSAKNADTITLLIDSLGGFVDDGIKMYEILRDSGKNIITKNIGDVCSAATLFWILAEKQNRFFDYSKGELVFHNPWMFAPPGDADQLKAISEEMKLIENQLEKIYEKHLGIKKELFSHYMDLNQPMSKDDFIKLGIGNVVSDVAVSACAKINFQKSNINKSKKMAEQKKSIANKLLSLLGLKSIIISTSDGVELEFPDLGDGETPKVGDMVNANGNPANGEFIMPNGEVYKCEGGVLVEIVAAQAKVPEQTPPTPPVPAQDLTAKIAELTAKITQLETEKVEMVKIMAEARTELVELKRKYPVLAKTEANTPTPQTEVGDKKENFKRKPILL